MALEGRFLLLEPHVALEDVVRDSFRRAFFLEALGDERAALERRLAFLSDARAFASLAGRPPLLLSAVRASHSTAADAAATVNYHDLI